MALRDDQRRRFARHLLLAELGDTQQAALCDAQLHFGPETNAGVRRTAEDYLQRAGVQTASGGEASTVVGASDESVRRVAGQPALTAAAEALLGALEAVEQIKRITGAGSAGSFPPNLTLSPEES